MATLTQQQQVTCMADTYKTAQLKGQALQHLSRVYSVCFPQQHYAVAAAKSAKHCAQKKARRMVPMRHAFNLQQKESGADMQT